MEYIFVACESIVGSIKITSPVTGNEWVVSSQGTWIPDEFERNERFLLLPLQRYCFKERRMVDTKIYLTNPSWAQMDSMPT